MVHGNSFTGYTLLLWFLISHSSLYFPSSHSNNTASHTILPVTSDSLLLTLSGSGTYSNKYGSDACTFHNDSYVRLLLICSHFARRKLQNDCIRTCLLIVFNIIITGEPGVGYQFKIFYDYCSLASKLLSLG